MSSYRSISLIQTCSMRAGKGPRLQVQLQIEYLRQVCYTPQEWTLHCNTDLHSSLPHRKAALFPQKLILPAELPNGKHSFLVAAETFPKFDWEKRMHRCVGLSSFLICSSASCGLGQTILNLKVVSKMLKHKNRKFRKFLFFCDLSLHQQWIPSAGASASKTFNKKVFLLE